MEIKVTFIKETIDYSSGVLPETIDSEPVEITLSGNTNDVEEIITLLHSRGRVE